MTRRTNARFAGFMFLFYIATALPEMVLYDRARGTGDTAARLASIAQHDVLMRMGVVLSFVTFLDAVFLGIALYGLTRDEDHDLALVALICRAGEGLINALSAMTKLGLLSFARAASGAGGESGATTQVNVIAEPLLRFHAWGTTLGAACFAVGSTLFAYLFLRGRTIPRWLAWLGVVGSFVLVLVLPLELGGFVGGPLTQLMWLPVAVFEIVLGFWLLIRGVNDPGRPDVKKAPATAAVPAPSRTG